MERPLSTLMLAADRSDRADSPASEALFAALYRELRGLARRELARSGPGAALGATSLLQRHWDKARIYLRHKLREGILD